MRKESEGPRHVETEKGACGWCRWHRFLCVEIVVTDDSSQLPVNVRTLQIMAQRRRMRWVQNHVGEAEVVQGEGSIALQDLAVSLTDFGTHMVANSMSGDPLGKSLEVWCCQRHIVFMQSTATTWYKFSLPTDFNRTDYKVHNAAVYARPQFKKLKASPDRVIYLFTKHGDAARAAVNAAWGMNTKGERTLADRENKNSTWGQPYDQGSFLSIPNARATGYV